MLGCSSFLDRTINGDTGDFDIKYLFIYSTTKIRAPGLAGKVFGRFYRDTAIDQYSPKGRFTHGGFRVATIKMPPFSSVFLPVAFEPFDV
jgi:hypothetical protein